MSHYRRDKQRQIRLTPIIRQYPSAKVIFSTYRVKTQAIHSPLILKQLGERLK